MLFLLFWYWRGSMVDVVVSAAVDEEFALVVEFTISFVRIA